MFLNFRRGGGAAYTATASGTSMSTPLVAGAAALVRQYFTDGFYSVTAAAAGAWPKLSSGFAPSAALLKATIINSASPLLFNDICAAYGATYSPPITISLSDCISKGGSPTAAQVRAFGGHGIPSLPRGLSFLSLGGSTRSLGALPSLVLPGLTTTDRPAPLRANPQVRSPPRTGIDPFLNNSGTAVFCIDTTTPFASARHPLSITLVWTDPPASVLANTALVNDLDLEVTSPLGSTASTIFGNTINASSPFQQRDTLNNAEKLSIELPIYTLAADGSTRLFPPYTVVVRGSRVPMGPQAFSLVVTGPGVILSSSSLCTDPAAKPSPTPAPASEPAAAPILSSPAGVALLSTTILLALLLAAAVAYIFWSRAAGSSSSSGRKSDFKLPYPIVFPNAFPQAPQGPLLQQTGVTLNPAAAAAALEMKPANSTPAGPAPPPPPPPSLPGQAVGVANWS